MVSQRDDFMGMSGRMLPGRVTGIDACPEPGVSILITWGDEIRSSSVPEENRDEVRFEGCRSEDGRVLYVPSEYTRLKI